MQRTKCRHSYRLLRLALIPAIAVFLFGGSSGLAQTPDNHAPAKATVCDGQVGAAFGLCNAYCEAMDCDTDSPRASEKACDVVYQKFAKLTGTPPPCACPCLVFPEFADVISGTNTSISACTILNLGQEGIIGAFVNNPSQNFFSADCTQTPGGCQVGGLFTSTASCGFAVPGSSGGFTDISVNQAQECSNLLFQAAANLGITCQ